MWVIADQVSAFGQAPGGHTGDAVGVIRYHRAAAMESADTLQHFRPQASVGTHAVALASWDYASLDQRPVTYQTPVQGDGPALTLTDSPGAYRYPDRATGSHRAQRRAEGLAAQRSLIEAQGTVRRLAAGSTFSLSNHPRYGGSEFGVLAGSASADLSDSRHQFAVIRLHHHARNNLPADFSAALDQLFSGTSRSGGSLSDAAEAPLYQSQLLVHPLSQPYAPLAPEDRPRDPGTGHAQSLRPRVHGSLTATVVGVSGAPVHTDRDHRIKVQFHFARGSRASSRLQHPSGADQAPGSDGSGTWVRVATPIAGQNWGGHFIPRVGQEVLIHCIDGDIDRPVVTGALYNGQGRVDAPGNQTQQTAPANSANAPAWFVGNGHGAVYSGIKSMALGASQSGQGDYNHLRFDDTPNQSATQLASTQHHSTLTLGHHRGHQNGGEGQAGNVRTQGLGHGASLQTQAYGAVRGGAGVLISADARANGTFGDSAQMDAAEAIAQLAHAEQLTQSLIDTAKSQQAEGAAAGKGKSPSSNNSSQTNSSPSKVIQAIQTTQADLDTGAGQSAAMQWASPHYVQSAPGGLAQLTAGAGFYTAGTSLHTTAGFGMEVLAQGASRTQVKDGITLFTHGSKPASSSAVTEQGITLHAAHGQVSVQAQSGEANLAAQQDVRLASTQADVSISAKQHVLLTAGGAYIKIEGSSIQLHAPGKITLKGGQKVFTSAQSASAKAVEMKKPGKLAECAAALSSAGTGGRSAI